MNRTSIAGLIGLLLLGPVGCNVSQSIVSPDAEKGRPLNSDSMCPSVDDMCAIITQEVESECPDDGFRNHGQLHSCRTQALDEQMKSLPACYSGAERLVMKKRVMIAVGLAEYVDEPIHHTDPRPILHLN